MNAMTTAAIIAASIACVPGNAQTPEASDSLSRELQEVVVTARQPATRLVGSTLVSAVAGTNLAGLGTALDVLAQLPMIKVEDSTVSVTGKNSVEIYIDGRPMRDAAELEQMLSSSMKKVELLMAPGAAYAATTGAVLKITTRQSFMQGLSVTDRLSIRRRRRWSAADYLDASYRTGKWELSVNGSADRHNQLTEGSTVNTLETDGKETVIGSRQHSSSISTDGSVRAGVSYTDGPQSFGICYRYSPGEGEFCNTGQEWLDSGTPLSREIGRHTHSNSHQASVYYDNTVWGSCLLHFDGDFRQSRVRTEALTTYPSMEASHPDVGSAERRKSALWAAKLSLDFPLGGGHLSVGTQDSHTHTSLDFRMHNDRVGEYIPSSLTDARQTSAALFASWSRSFGGFSLSAGARYEYVDYGFSVDGKRDNDVSRKDHLLTPDFTLGYAFSDYSQFSLSYKMATVRPPYSHLTGSLSYVGIHETEGGNPGLRDERMHDVQLFGMWKDFMLQADFIRSADTYAFVKELSPAGCLRLLMHPVNIDVSALSMYIVWSRPVGCWTPNVTAGIYRQWLTLAGGRHDRPLFSYYFDNTFSLPCGWTVTANLSGRSCGDIHTNRFGPTPFTMDASVGKSFLGRTLTVRLSAADIFNTANHDWTMDTYGVHVDKRQSFDRRGLTLDVIFSLHPRKSRYKGSPASESELNRL